MARQVDTVNYRGDLRSYQNDVIVVRVSPEKKNPLGPTGEQVRANIKRLREKRGLSYRELSERLTAAGRPIPTLGLSRIEKGERRVDTDDLMALSIVLGVNPQAFLLPPTIHGESEVTGAGSVRNESLWDWADGRLLLRPVLDDGSAYVDFQTHARPEGRRRFRPPPRLVDLLRQRGVEITDNGDGTWSAIKENGERVQGRF